MYLVAIRTASIATSKQSVAVAAAITASGASALRPCTAWNRSDCSALVGMPVEGPARWELTTTSGSSVARSEEHTSELQSRLHLVCRLLLEKKKLGRTPERDSCSRAPAASRSAPCPIGTRLPLPRRTT